ncbi:holin [Mycobacterium phage Typha]|uniref:Holin n=1 Tax=Mycobacterium phage Typha TaxID=2517971 RepID=A0A482J6K0_9CAUD|nr:holin [Mycobacterium phage Typha]QBP29690.1 holin [Mycobacterium phage Typha]URM86477.1 holin [Mycobacterium phage Hilltopfarm]
MNILDLRSGDDVRRFLHVALPGIAALLVTVSVLTTELAPLVVSTVLTIADSVLSRVNTTDKVRKWFYPLMGAAALGLLALGHYLNTETAQWLAIVPILLGGGVGAANTNSSADPTTAG